MNAAKTSSADPVLKNLDRLLPDLEALYTDVHAHPELSMQVHVECSELGEQPVRRAGGNDCVHDHAPRSKIRTYVDECSTETGPKTSGASRRANVRQPCG